MIKYTGLSKLSTSSLLCRKKKKKRERVMLIVESKVHAPDKQKKKKERERTSVSEYAKTRVDPLEGDDAAIEENMKHGNEQEQRTVPSENLKYTTMQRPCRLSPSSPPPTIPL